MLRIGRAFLLLIVCAFVVISANAADTTGLNLALPTGNDALFHGDGAAFYQHIIRDFRGVKTTPWEGGQYGFVRNPVETPNGIIYTRFHEGIDIKPLHRDIRGEPTDPVRAIADGTVVYVNLAPGFSNYGRYVVVEHHWPSGNFYSLYAHLASPVVEIGTKVNRGDQVGVMGHTGEGIDVARAHVHLELNLLLGQHFDEWYAAFYKNEPNRHGIYNGINLTGLDIARLYLALRRNPGLTTPEFLSGEETFYKVTLPASPNFDLVQRYPWLLRHAPESKPAAWEISFNRAGVPLQVEGKQDAIAAPTLSFIKKGAGNYADLTRGVVAGSGDHARLSESGERLMRLLIWPE